MGILELLRVSCAVWIIQTLADDTAENRPPVTYYTSIPAVAARPPRRYEASKLKDLKKKLDLGQCRQDEIDSIAQELMDDCAEVSVHVSNTTALADIVQAIERLHRQYHHSKAIRTHFVRHSLCHARTNSAPLGNNRCTQEWYMGGAKDH